MYKCKKCGSTDVKVKIWYDPNIERNNEDFDAMVKTSLLYNEDIWCSGCGDYTDVELKPDK